MIEDLLVDVRSAKDRAGLRGAQTDLFGYLLDAEERYGNAQRRYKRGETDGFEVTFWRRACVQLRTVGDAIAWKFLGYQRKTILLMRRGEQAGHFHGKAGTDVEWALFNEHWDEGEPTLLTGITTCIRHGDLLVDKGSGTLMIIEAKKNIRHAKGAQKRRGQELVNQINAEGRYEALDGPSWIVETNVPLRTYWRDAEPALERASRQGAATWVPTPGLAVLFLIPSALNAPSFMAAEEMIEAERQTAAAAMGASDHRILVHGTNYPYRAGPVAPLSIFPVAPHRAARLVTGDILFSVELHPERLANALRSNGIDAEVVLPPRHGDLLPSIDVLRFRHGTWNGVMHPSGVEPVAIELQDPDQWARAAAAAVLPTRDPRFGLYFCAQEDEAWS